MGTIINYLENLAHVIPLELFVLISSFIEEIVAPIPSPIAMTLAGTLAKTQNYHLLLLLWLSFFGTIGKTVGAYILYVLADKMEDILGGRLGKFLGVTHKDIENIGKKMQGNWKDTAFLFIARALPIVPSAPISLGCGIIKVNKKTFLSTTFTGTFVRNLMYLYLGYAGFGNYEDLSHGLHSMESVVQVVLALIIVGIIVWAYLHRKKRHSQ